VSEILRQPCIFVGALRHLPDPCSNARNTRVMRNL
jgi:hypothetical protein